MSRPGQAAYRLDTLHDRHVRRGFESGQPAVDGWLTRFALQNQKKRLSTTRVLVTKDDVVAGFYTLAIGQVDFEDLPAELSRNMPRRLLPVAILAWLGVEKSHQGLGLGTRLLAQALRDGYEAGRTFPFVAVLIDAINEDAQAFYGRWSFRPLPGRAHRLFVSAAELEAMMKA